MNFKLTTKLFCKIIKHSYNWTVVWVDNWLITGPNYAFDFFIDEPYQVKTLELNETGTEKRSDWGINMDRFENLISAISESGLISSLSAIAVWDWGLDSAKTEWTFKKYNLEHTLMRDDS